MRYVSTRDTSKTFEFKDVFIKGLAHDGGLFIPEKLTKYTENEVKDFKKNQPRLLTVDHEVVVPVNKVVKVLITANDVLHAWALPSFGVKRDAVPGRINETWFKAEKVGTYYGQCSELCGIKHAFMPITVRVVSEEDYAEWLTGAKIKFAKEPLLENENIKLASN